MHEAQAKDTEPQQEAAATRRPFKYFVAVRHRQVDLETGKPAAPEFLEFEDKAAMRETLGQAKYEGAELRVVRGYEMKVKAKHHISVN